jgi:two-component system nitrate/nitrite response regulator NarP
VVDDDRSWMEIIREILEDCGLDVDTAENRQAALALIGRPHRLAVVDLALNEHDHRNQDGLMIIQELRRSDPACAAVLLTGYATVELAVSAIKQFGAADVLRKEVFSRAELRRMVAQILSITPRPAGGGDGRAHPGTQAQAHEVLAEPLASVLVVEDDPGWQEILTELMGDAGYRVRVCSSFGEALGCLRRERYNLAVVDLNLSQGAARPVSSRDRPESLEGYRLLAGIQAGGAAVIILSGVTDPGLIEQVYNQQHIFAFLEKQAFNRHVFLQTVREALQVGHVNPELAALTEREREVLELLAKGLTNKEIAETLVITTNTVKRHLKSIFAKLDIHTRAAAVAKIKSD